MKILVRTTVVEYEEAGDMVRTSRLFYEHQSLNMIVAHDLCNHQFVVGIETVVRVEGDSSVRDVIASDPNCEILFDVPEPS